MPKKNKIEDYLNKVYGRLTIIGEAEPYIRPTDGGKNTVVICKCECGNEKEIVLNTLKKGDALSCGCLQKEKMSLRQTKHGGFGTPEYKSWQSMKRRCLVESDEHYPIYGGRGISIQESWINDFQAFFNYIGKRPIGTTLDRKDPNGNYEEGNVRWATAEVQCNNKRNNVKYLYKDELLTKREISNKYGFNFDFLNVRLKGEIKGSVDDIIEKPKRIYPTYTYNGETKTLAEFIRQYGLIKSMVSNRIQNGWDIVSAIETPKEEVLKLSYKGELLTVAELSVKYNINRGVLVSRISDGWGVVDAIEKPIAYKNYNK